MSKFLDLMESAVGGALARQLALGDYLGNHQWEVNTQQGRVDFGKKRVFRIQILGTENQRDGTWMWAWAYSQSGLPESVTELSTRLRDHGAAEGIPELLRVPDVAGSTAGRGSVPSYPAVESAVRALARVVEYAVWLRMPHEEAGDPSEVDHAGAKRLLNTILMESPQGRDLTSSEVRRLLAAYGVDVWQAVDVGSADEAVRVIRPG